MIKNYLTLIIALISLSTFSQDRVNATVPAIDAVANGKLTEATGWIKNDDGKWVSRKNKIPANKIEEFKSLIDYEADGLGENRENFIYIEHRNIKIADSSYTILIKKFKDGYYKYESISQGWVPQNSLIYYVFKTSELDKLKNLEADKTHAIKIKTIYSNFILYLDPKSSLNTVAKDLYKKISDNYNMYDLGVYLKVYKGNVRFIIQNFEEYLPQDLEKAYYETPIANFEKLFKLK
ncbi:hypothetical protein FMM05_16725 [Flavobacterium zepuense]|uniref:Uncharacterized protein n=1 Tax=Flavobacterium zepuense TaxID=2593302 RepID=A0A552UW99_9FLAO|nr:hypothetical protein [Flavobacterium zepuense]TRW22524.1 hypothetical protein FMM05_16725 [Flavobacterium zepuense]